MMPLSLNHINTIKSQRDYRVGDIMYRWGLKWEESMHNVLNQPAYKGTILHDYLIANNGNTIPNAKLLGDIINLHAQRKGLESIPNSIGVHIRAGDVISIPHRFLSIDYSSKAEAIISANPEVLTVLLVTCFTYGDFYERNLWEFTDVKQQANELCLQILFEEINRRLGKKLKLEIHSSRDADDDMIILFKSDHFIRDTGGFSKAIAEARSAHEKPNY
jgi:hypothetical protein